MKNKITLELSFRIFKEGKIFIADIRELDLSGYGETKDKAIEMLDFVVKDYFKSLNKKAKKVK